ncbi:uncharacterized protein ACWYII_028117 [Salvelinus alpinus]
MRAHQQDDLSYPADIPEPLAKTDLILRLCARWANSQFWLCWQFSVDSSRKLKQVRKICFNYERLRIGGLIIAGLLVAGGLFVLLNPKCTRKNKKSEDDTSEL